MKLNDKQKDVIQRIVSEVGATPTRKQIVEWFKRTSGIAFEGNRVPPGVGFPHFITNNKGIRMTRGAYDLMLLLSGGSSSDAIQNELVANPAESATELLSE
jgi:hypothetical protein